MGATRDRFSRKSPAAGKKGGSDRAREETRRLLAEAGLVRRVLDSLPDIAHIYDHEWRWRHINPPAAEWLRSLGHEPSEMIGRSVWDVFPDSPGEAHARQAVREQREVVYETPFEDRVHETRVVPLPDGAVSLTRDITERKRAENSVRDEAARAQLLADATRALSEARLDLAAVIGAVARQLADFLGDLCMIRLRDGEWLRSVGVAHTDREAEGFVRALVEREPQRVDEGLASRVVTTGNPLLIPEAGTDTIEALKPEYRSYAESFGLASVLIAPLRVQDRVLGTLTLCRDRPGRPYDVADLELLRDIADRAALAVENALLYEAAERSRAAAEEANRVKGQFLGIMSHELRTPLNAVLGYADLLLAEVDHPLSEEQKARVERIKQSAMVQTELIDEVLAFARIEAGREEELHPERVDVRACVREVCDLVQPIVDKKGIGLCALVPGTPLEVVTDVRKLRQILLNLAGNAAKFTTEGEVEICLEGKGEWIEIGVRDTGPGVPAEKLDFIFEPFTQVDQSAARQAGGIGLGLAISRRLAQLLGGEVTVESQVGRGSTFSVRIPAAGLPPAP